MDLYRIFYHLHSPQAVLVPLHSDKPKRYIRSINVIQLYFLFCILLEAYLVLKELNFGCVVVYLTWWLLEAWGTCSHKKIVAASAATAFWNLSSVKTRIFTGNFITWAINCYIYKYKFDIFIKIKILLVSISFF